MRAYQRMPTPKKESKGARRFRNLLPFFHRKASDNEALERFVGRTVEDEDENIEVEAKSEEQPNLKKFLFWSRGRKVEEENHEGDDEEESKKEEVQKNEEQPAKKKFFSLPKQFAKLKTMKAKPSTTTTTKSSEDSDTEPTTPPTKKATKPVIEPQRAPSPPLPPPPSPPPAPAVLTKERSCDSSRSGSKPPAPVLTKERSYDSSRSGSIPPAPVLSKERSYDSSRSGKSGQVTKMTTPNTPPSPPKESLFFKKNICMEVSSTVSVDDYNSVDDNKELAPVTSIDTFITKTKASKKKKDSLRPQLEDDEGSMISVLTMDPVLQAISRREAELGTTFTPPKKKKKKKSSPSPVESTRSTNDSAVWEATMMNMTNPYGNPSIAEGEHEDDGSDALSEIAPLDLVSL